LTILRAAYEAGVRPPPVGPPSDDDGTRGGTDDDDSDDEGGPNVQHRVRGRAPQPQVQGPRPIPRQ
ncbi:hypothetical protein KI387_037677, partial [Taxus chinensis]